MDQVRHRSKLDKDSIMVDGYCSVSSKDFVHDKMFVVIRIHFVDHTHMLTGDGVGR